MRVGWGLAIMRANQGRGDGEVARQAATSGASVSAIRRVWRWFVGGLAFWSALVILMAFLLAGRVAPLYREARHFVVALQSALTAQPVATADLVPIAYTSGNLFGVNTFLYQEVEEEKVRRSLAMIKEAGFGFIREQVAWQEFERGSKGNYWDERWQRETWQSLDRLVRLVEEYGLEMVARVDYPPDWSQPPGTTWHAAPPTNYEDYGDFVYTLASRYRGRIKYYQIWNEPNLTIEWSLQPVSPADYTRLLKIAYTRIKEADPDAVVIAAALAPTIEEGPLNMSDLTFLRRMYEAGAKDYFDMASLNPYGLRSGPDDRRFSPDDTNFSRPILARHIMVEYGDAAKPIFAAETGWNALPLDYPQAPDYGRTTRDQQARYTYRAYERVQQEWPWLGMMALWHFRMVDARLAAGQSYYFGAVADDFTPYPVFQRVRDLATAPPALYPGFRQEDHRALAYVGDWHRERDPRAALGGYVAGAPGARVEFRFWGGALDLVTRRGTAAGRIAVQIDGSAVAASAVGVDASGRAVLDLYAEGEEWQARVPLARGLTPAEHTAVVEVLDGQGTFVLDGFVVQAGAGRSPLPLLGALGLGVALFLAWVGGRAGALAGADDAERQPGSIAAAAAGRRSGVEAALVRAAVLLVALAALGLRVYRAGAQSFWYDEGISVSLAGRSLLQILHDAAADIHPPLYYFVLHYWVRLVGDSEFAVRFVSAAAGALAVCLVYRLGERLLSRWVGLLAAVFVACAPLAVYYGQEARMYSLLLALSTLWSLVWLRLLAPQSPQKREHRRLLWLAYAGLGVVCLYTHYFAFLLLGVHVLGSAIARLRQPRRLAGWLTVQGLIAAAFLPWLLNMSFRQLDTFQQGRQPLGLSETVVKMLDDFTVGHLAQPNEQMRLAFAVLLAVGLLAALAGERRVRRGGGVALLYAAVPLGALLVLNTFRAAYQPRFVLLAAPGLYLLFGQGIAGLAEAVRRLLGNGRLARGIGGLTGLGVLVVAVLPLVGTLPALYFDQRWQRDDYRGVVRHIEANAGPNDAIVLDSPWQVDVFRLYYRGQQPYYPLPAQVPVDRARTEAALAEILGRHSGVWAILWGWSEVDPDSIVERWLDAHAFKAQDSWFGGVRLAHYLVAPVGERVAVDVRFGDDIRLRGYAWQTREGRPGEVLPLTLYWEATGPIDRRYKVFVHVLDEQERIWGQRDSEPAGGARPTTDWKVGEEVEDRIGLPLDAAVKPGRYQVEVGLYHYPSMERPPVFDAAGRPLGNRVLIGPVEVK